MITITDSAQEYLSDLLAKQDGDEVNVRIYITDPGTPTAETCIAYCRPGETQEEDQVMQCSNFKAFLEARSLPFLEDALVDYAEDRFGGQLTIKAPNARLPQISDNSPLEDKVNYLLYNEINPSLASHGGNITLVAIEEEIAILQFGGGCQGCSGVDMTLKQGVEKTILEKIPQLKGVRDVTDHTDRSQAYFS
jgi:Fe/S biogenesis protein NfuA